MHFLTMKYFIRKYVFHLIFINIIEKHPTMPLLVLDH